MSIIRITHDRKVALPTKNPLRTNTYFGISILPYKYRTEQVVKEFSGLTEGLEKAINYAFNVIDTTERFKIEQIIGDSKPEELYFSNLVAMLKHSARSQALTEERNRIENKRDEKEIHDQIRKSTAWQVKTVLRQMTERLTDEVMAELEKEDVEND